MATENINSELPRSIPFANSVSPPLSEAPSPREESDVAKVATPTVQNEADSVSISPDAAGRASSLETASQARETVGGESRGEQGSPEQEQSPAPGQEPSQTAPFARKESHAVANTTDSSNASKPSPAETRRSNNEEQAEQQVINSQTIQNYTNASLNTRINGRKIDENV